MSYRDRTRKQITLPSGATCVIRKLRPRDFVSVGSIPTTYPEQHAKRGLADKAEDERWALRAERVILSECVCNFEHDGKVYRIVDKRFSETSADEIAIEELEETEAAFIVSEVMRFSGLEKGASREAPGFQPNGSGHDSVGPNGGTLRATAVNDPTNVSG